MSSISIKDMVQRHLAAMIQNPHTTMDALCQAWGEAAPMLGTLTVGELTGVRPEPKPAYTPTPSTLTQCVEVLKAHGTWLDAQDLALVVDARPEYINKVLQDAIRDITTFPVMLKREQMHSAGRPTPHYKYVELNT